MIGALLSASFLVIQTNAGHTTTAGPMSAAGCAAARCLAQYGHSCAQEARDAAYSKKLQAEWRKHPVPEICIIAGKSCVPLRDLPQNVGPMDGAATKTAMCVE